MAFGRNLTIPRLSRTCRLARRSRSGLKTPPSSRSCSTPVEETKAALAAAGIANEVMPIPFNITLLKFGNEKVLFDAGTGGQFQPTAGAMIANMAATGIKPALITRVIVSHFHPDHVLGLMS